MSRDGTCANCLYWQIDHAATLVDGSVMAPCHHRHLKLLFGMKQGPPVLTTSNFGCVHHYHTEADLFRRALPE